MASSTSLHATAKPLFDRGLGHGFCEVILQLPIQGFVDGVDVLECRGLAVLGESCEIGLATTSCSAWASISEATTSGSAVSSQTTNTSEGPANISIPTRAWVAQHAFAAVTHALPGPQITSARAARPRQHKHQ